MKARTLAAVTLLRRGALVVLLASQLILCGSVEPAAAARVEMDETTPGGAVSGRFVAGAGERNDLSMWSVLANSFRVQDSGAPVTAGAGCTLLGPAIAECVASVWGLHFVRMELGDGNDLLRSTAAASLRVDGGTGDDRLTGGSRDDRLDGGGGRDEVRGADGDDVLSDGDGSSTDADVLNGGAEGADWVSYETRIRPVTVDLRDPATDGGRGENDTLISIENVHGGSGDDRLSGDSRANSFADAGGTNVFRGRGGDDVFRDARAGTVHCGAGDDEVRGVTRKVLIARDCELLAEPGDFIEVNLIPRETATGYALRFRSNGEDPPIGEVVIAEALARRRIVARGRIQWTHPGAIARLHLSRLGARLLARGQVRATVRVSAGKRSKAWGIWLPRRLP